MIVTPIVFFGQHQIMVCDAKCDKAWGINNRPRHQLSETDEDDYAWLADDELGIAPDDPGTYEGLAMEAKPITPEERHNRWCARECERCTRVVVGESFELPDFSKRFYNVKPHTREVSNE